VFSIGEIAGDVEFDINYQEREFYGQYNFPIYKAHFGGKVEARARRVELNVNSLKNFFNTNGTAAYISTAETSSFVFDPDVDGGSGQATTAGAGLPRPLYVRFTHKRTDDSSKTVKIHLPKAYTMSLNIPFTREDIVVQDVDFMAVVDTTLKLTSGATSGWGFPQPTSKIPNPRFTHHRGGIIMWPKGGGESARASIKCAQARK
jgi:hypothetical protein